MSRRIWLPIADPPPQAYCADDIEEPEDFAPFDWYASAPASTVEAMPAEFDFNIEQETQLYVEDIYPDYYAQPPPLDVFPPPAPSLEQEEQPEDEPFGFEQGPPPANVFGPPEPSLVQEEQPEDEPFGFELSPLVPDFAEDVPAPSLEQAEEPEDQSFGFEVGPQAGDVFDPPLASFPDQADEPEDEFYGLDAAPLSDDATSDALGQELGNDAESDEFYDGFADGPLSDDFGSDYPSPPSLEVAEETDDESFGFDAIPLPDEPTSPLYSWRVQGIGIKSKTRVQSEVKSDVDSEQGDQ